MAQSKPLTSASTRSDTLHILRDHEAHKILCDVLQAEAGRGGFGKVIIGKHETAGFVAVKCFPVNGGEREQAAMKRMIHHEFGVLFKTRHENIANVFGLTKWPGAMGIIMRYYEGGNLLGLLLSRYIPLGHSLRLRLAFETAHGVAYIHNCGKNKRIIHGDMKPENILLTADLNVKIADFGCAMLASFTGSTTNQDYNPQEAQALTLFYAAPEKLLRGAGPKKEQDVFSCAVIFYEMLLRILPYPSKEIFLEMIRNEIRPNCEAIQELKDLSDDNDRAIVEVMEGMMTRCWHQDPAQRPNMLEVRDGLQQHLATQDPALISQQVTDAVKEMDIKHPAANHNPTVPLHQFNPSTGEFPRNITQPPQLQPNEPSQHQGDQPLHVQPRENPPELSQHPVEQPIHVQSRQNPPELSQHQGNRPIHVQPRENPPELLQHSGENLPLEAAYSQANITAQRTEERKGNRPIHVQPRENPPELSQHSGENLPLEAAYSQANITAQRTEERKGEFLVIGGKGSERNCVKYDVTTKLHPHLPKLNKKRYCLTSAKVRHKIYVFGGWEKAAEKSCEMLDLAASGRWRIMHNMLNARFQAASAVIGDNIYVTGGWNRCRLSSCEVYDVNSDKWSRVPDMLKKRSFHGMCSIENSLYCVAGSTDNSCEHYDVRSKKWSLFSSMNESTDGLSCVPLNGKIYVTGGGWTASSHHECYDTTAGKWTTLAPMNIGRRFHGACVINGKIYVAGGNTGFQGSGDELSSVEVYDPTQDSWTHCFDLENPIHGHTVVAL